MTNQNGSKEVNWANTERQDSEKNKQRPTTVLKFSLFWKIVVGLFYVRSTYADQRIQLTLSQNFPVYAVRTLESFNSKTNKNMALIFGQLVSTHIITITLKNPVWNMASPAGRQQQLVLASTSI